MHGKVLDSQQTATKVQTRKYGKSEVSGSATPVSAGARVSTRLWRIQCCVWGVVSRSLMTQGPYSVTDIHLPLRISALDAQNVLMRRMMPCWGEVVVSSCKCEAYI